ncbi:MAG TPA: ABC transporter permease [Syntrophomonadaceae bacterium]|nr:ABC transporter permease [Syntrophomonadaceae bacterium]
MVLGVYLTFRILDFADLTVDGSFTLGGAIAASIIFAGGNPWLATVVALCGGLLAGAVTGILNTTFRITPLLSGILTMTGLYSINLRVMGRANISLLRADTVITRFTSALHLDPAYGTVVLGLIVVGLVGVALYLFLKTEIGLALQATGDNEQMIRALGVNTDRMKLLGLALSNGMVSLSGALVAQNQQFADAGMGIGMIIAGLASVIIGEALIGTTTLRRTIIAVVCGSVIYRGVLALVLRLGLAPTDFKLLTALIVIVALASPQVKAWWQKGKQRQKGVSPDA